MNTSVNAVYEVLAPNYALDRAVSDGTIAAPMLRPVGVTSPTGSPVQNGEIRRTLAREGPRQGKRA